MPQTVNLLSGCSRTREVTTHNVPGSACVANRIQCQCRCITSKVRVRKTLPLLPCPFGSCVLEEASPCVEDTQIAQKERLHRARNCGLLPTASTSLPVMEGSTVEAEPLVPVELSPNSSHGQDHDRTPLGPEPPPLS